MRLEVTIVLALLLVAVGCGKENPAPPKAAPPKAAAKPKVPESPEELARAFQHTLLQNNAEAMMMLSLLGHGTNAWIEFSQITLQEQRRSMATELTALEAKLREQRSDTEQARVFTLKVRLANLEKNHAASFNNIDRKLPADRHTFKEQGYYQLQQALKEQGMVQDQLKLAAVDTTGVTDAFLGSTLRGGEVVLRYTQNGAPVSGTISFNCALLDDLGWVIVDPPKVNPNRPFGPQAPANPDQPEPFPAPSPPTTTAGGE
jgi:hypothetical protein